MTRAGYYKIKLVKNGPYVPCELKYGPPPDPVTGEVLDRAPRYWAVINGEVKDGPDQEYWVDVLMMARKSIEKAEHGHMLAISEWAAKEAPELPEAKPGEMVDLNKINPVI